jgi:flagellar hook capping protein FlgD
METDPCLDPWLSFQPAHSNPDAAATPANHAKGAHIMHVQRAIGGSLATAMLSCVFVAVQADRSYAQWIQTNGPKGGAIRSFVAVPNGAGSRSLYTGQIRVWRTDDNGASWTHLSNGLTDPNAFALLAVPNGSGGNDILVGTGDGIFRSANNGASWNASSNGVPPNLSIYALTSGPNGSGGTNLYAGTFMGNAFRSTDNGASWTAANSGLPVGQANVNALTTTASGTVLAGTMNGIYRSTDFGGSWMRLFSPYAFSFAKHAATIYAGTSSGVWRSTNDGVSWTAINTGMGFTWVYAMAAIPNGSGVTLFAGAGGVLSSTDEGATWTSVNHGLTSLGVYALTTAPNAGGGTDLYAGTGEGIFRTTNNGANWTDVSFVYSGVQGLEVTPSGAILAGTEGDVFRSNDGGASWTDAQINVPILDFAVNPNGTSGISLFAGGATSGIFKSTDDGATWVDANNTLDDTEVNSLGAVPNGSGGTNVIAGTYSGIFISTSDGGSWQHVEPSAMPLDFVVTPNGSAGHNIFGGGFGGVWLSTNGGVTWALAGLQDKTPQGMATTGNGANLFAGGNPFGVYRSTNNGATWALVNHGLTDLRISALVSPDGTNLFAGGAGGVYLSTDQGDSWTSVGTGLTTGVFSLAVSADGSILLAGTTGFGVWKRPLSEMIQVVAVLPGGDRGLALDGNRPNPFNTGTTIQYSLPRTMAVHLVIHDVTGRTVRTLVNGVQSAGEWRAIWDGRDERGSVVSPGMYVYRLHAGGASLARKMALLK